MIRHFGGLPLYVCCISAGRPQRVGPMEEQVGPMTWFVPEDQWEAYSREGARELRRGSDTNAATARNSAFKTAWVENVPCCQLDDDLRWCKRKDFSTGEVLPITGREALDRVLTVFMATDFKLGGIPNTNNPYFSRQPMTTRTFVRSHLWMAKPCALLIDEQMRVKFDYDYTLHHILTYGGVCRVDEVVCDFDYNRLPGGHVADDRMEQQEQAIRYLIRRWGTDVIKRNPRRPGEILLHPPRPNRVRL